MSSFSFRNSGRTLIYCYFSFPVGDMAEYDKENNTFRILGRSSVDIIKSGGYKISALDVEAVIIHHPLVDECVVIGVKDLEWGERVTAVVVLHPGKKEEDLTLEQLRDYCKTKLASYQCPTQLKIVDKLERNAVGKVNKKELNAQLFPPSSKNKQ
jgi:malonyl-CoA/methylmalonyl-CoA synthetase